MVSPSIRLVLVLTLLQVYFLSSVHGLTLPLKTVTKCESFPKKSPKPKADCSIVDNIAAESSKPDKPFSTLLPTDISINSALNSARNGPLVNVKETLCPAPAIPKNASIIKPCLDASPNSGLSSLSDSTCSSNPFGLKLPVSVSNTVASLPNPNLKSTPVASSNGCSKSGKALRSNLLLEDCVSASTVQSGYPVLSNSASTNSGLSCPNTCNSNAYSSGFKSSFSVSSTCSSANSASPNPSPVNSCGNCNTNVAPANSGPASLETSPVRPQNVVKQDVSLSLPANQMCSPDSGPSNLALTPSNQNYMVSNNRPLTQSCLSNSSPVSQTCTKNMGSTNSPFTNTCPSNVGTTLPASLPTMSGNLPASQVYSKNIGKNSQTSSSNIGSTCQTNTVPKNLPVSCNQCNSAPNSLPVNLIQQQQDCSSNIGLNNLLQGSFGSSGSNSLISTQSIGSNNMLASQSYPTNNSPAIPINSMSSNSGTNTITVINNNVNTVTAAQNTLCYPSSSSRVVSDSALPLNFSPANQYQTTCALTSSNPNLSSSNTGNNIVTSPSSSAVSSSANTPSASLSNSYAICASENSINTINNQNYPYITSASSTEIPKCDGSCPTSIQQNYPSGLSINANSFGPNCQINQTPFPPESTKSVTPLVPIIKDPIIYPTIQTYPPPASVFPVTSSFIVPDQIPVAPIDPTLSNSCPITPNCKTSINDYFKGVKAATSKLNDFISSFSNKFGIKSFPSMQSFSPIPSETLSQTNSATVECPENLCYPGLPPYIPRPKPTYFPAMQRNICPCVDTTPLQQEQSPSCPILTQDFNQSEDSPLVCVELPSNATVSTSPPNSSLCSPTVISSPTTAAIPQVPSSVTFKAPVVPKTIVSSYNYPICPTSIANNFQDGLSSLSCNNNSPMPLSNLPTATPANLLSKLNVGSYNVPDTPISFKPSNCYRPLSSILNGAKLTSPSTPPPIVSTYDDVTNILIPDILSAVLPKKACPCETCRKAFPFLSSISVNTSPDCNTVSDCSTALSNVDECSVSLSPACNSCLSLDLLPSLDESQLDECCKNLENIIAMLELSLNLNGGFDCDLDAVPDILSTL